MCNPIFPNPLSYNIGLFYGQWHYGQSLVRDVGGPGSCSLVGPIAGPFSLETGVSLASLTTTGLSTPYLCVMDGLHSLSSQHYCCVLSEQCHQLAEPGLGFEDRGHVQEGRISEIWALFLNILLVSTELSLPICLVPDMSQGLFGLKFFRCSMIKGYQIC